MRPTSPDHGGGQCDDGGRYAVPVDEQASEAVDDVPAAGCDHEPAQNPRDVPRPVQRGAEQEQVDAEEEQRDSEPVAAGLQGARAQPRRPGAGDGAAREHEQPVGGEPPDQERCHRRRVQEPDGGRDHRQPPAGWLEQQVEGQRDREFLIGLDLVLDGLERNRPPTGDPMARQSGGVRPPMPVACCVSTTW